MGTLKQGQKCTSYTKGLGVAALLLVWIASCQAMAQDIKPDEEIVRSETVSLLPEPKAGEYFFYFRDEDGYVVYLPTEFATELLPAQAQQFLPLQRHVDIFEVFLNEPSLERFKTPRGQWQIRFQVSLALEAGEAAVWWYRDGFLDSVVVDHYTDHCCTAGRIFKTPAGRVLFRIRDTIIE